MRILKFIAVGFLCIGFTGLDLKGQGPSGPLSQFRGSYQIAGGPQGTVRVSDALGGAYTEWTVTFGQPSHELRLFVGGRSGDGTFRVWRFEQEPSPGVSHEGTARLEGQELIADFPHVEGPPGKMIRERWRLTNGGLQFVLEATPKAGVAPSRVGGFAAVRQ